MTDDFHLATQRIGEGGTPVVFLHGLMGRGRNFMTAAKGLRDDESLLVDLPNHGDSSWTDGFDYVEQADLVAHHLRQDFAADRPVVLVGHSMGGKVAMALALRHPDLVERLVVVDIAPEESTDTGTDFAHLLGSLRELELDGLASRSAADAELASKIPNQTTRGFLLQNLRRGDGGFDWQPNLEMLYAKLPTIGGFPDLGKATYPGPVMWVGGENSNYVTAEHEPTMRAYFPRVTKVVVKDAGHWVHSEQPERFLSVLRYFIHETN